MDVLVRRYGTLVDVTVDGVNPTPRIIIDLLTQHLWYVHFVRRHGARQYDQISGRRDSVNITNRNMYSFEDGRLTTMYGFLPKIRRILSAAGHRVFYVDVSPVRPRPDCYVPDWDTVRRRITFRPRQEECLQAMCDNECGIINAAPAFGKTFLFAAQALLYPRAKIAVVTASVDVAKRIVNAMTAFIPNVGLVGGGSHTYGRVTVYTAHSLHCCDGDIDFLLADEAHQLMTGKLSARLGQVFRHSRNYAATACPGGRMDGAGALLEMLFGEEIFRLTYSDGVALELITPIRVRWLRADFQQDPGVGRQGVPLMRWGIWRHDARNRMIAEDFHTMYTDGQQVLFATATIEHALRLWQYIPEAELCFAGITGKEIARYQRMELLPGDFVEMSAGRRDSIRAGIENGSVRCAIVTDVFSTGVDFAGLQVVYRCDARGSAILDTQWPGRASRRFDGKLYAEVVDLTDDFNPSLKGKARTRRRHYREQGFAQDWPTGRRQNSCV